MEVPLIIDGSAVPDLKLGGPGAGPLFECGPDGSLTIRNLELPQDAVAGCSPVPDHAAMGD